MADNKSSNKKPKKQRLKKVLTHPLFICGTIITITLAGTGIYYFSSGGSVGIEHNIANKNYKQAKVNQAAEFKKHHTDSFPTIEEVQSKLKEKFNTKDLTTISIDKIQSAMKEIWGNKAADAIINGYVLSNTMTPSDADQAEVNLAKYENDTKNYVGFSTTNPVTNLYKKGYETSPTTFNFGPAFAYGDQINWKNINNFNISQPFVTLTPVSKMINPNSNDNSYYTLVMFVQPTEETTWQAVKEQMQSMTIKANGKVLKLAGSHNNSNSKYGIYSEANGLQLSKVAGSTFNKSNNIFPNSIIPICFDIPAISNKSSYDVSVSDMSSYLLKYSDSNTIKFS